MQTTPPRVPRVLIGCTGSVASIKLPELVAGLLALPCKPQVQVVATEHALHFFDPRSFPPSVTLHRDADEWGAWRDRGDPVLHIELRRWADVLLLAPLDANTLAKMTAGLCDNLLTCVARAWERRKPVLFAPAMNTAMYEHPLTAVQIAALRSFGYEELPSVDKVLVCGDHGIGAMAELSTIIARVSLHLQRILAEFTDDRGAEVDGTATEDGL